MARKNKTGLKPAALKSATKSASTRPSEERVRSRAYEIYTERRHSGVYGHATDDWIAAERQLQARDKRPRTPRWSPPPLCGRNTGNPSLSSSPRGFRALTVPIQTAGNRTTT